MCEQLDPAKLEEKTMHNNNNPSTNPVAVQVLREETIEEKNLYNQRLEKARKWMKKTTWINKSIQLAVGEFLVRKTSYHNLERVIKVLDDPLKANLSCSALCDIALYLMLIKKQSVTPLYYLDKAKKKARTFFDRATVEDYQMFVIIFFLFSFEISHSL